MSDFRGHWLIGIVVIILFILLNYIFSWGLYDFTMKTILTLSGITLFYSLFPDIDIGTSKIRNFVFITALLLAGYFIYTNQTLLSFAILGILIIILFLKHRGITHSFVTGFFLSLPLLVFGWQFALAGYLAYLSHLAIDGELKG